MTALLEEPVSKWQARTRLLNRLTILETERAPYRVHWSDVTRHILPRLGRYFKTESRKTTGRSHYNDIIDPTASMALRTLRSGMMAGASNPATRWFRLRTPDPERNKFHTVKQWLDDVVDIMMEVFNRSNAYRVVQTQYGEMGGFGTSVSVLLSHPERVIHLYPSPIGEFSLDQNYEGTVDTMYRRFYRTVGECVKRFGLERMSKSVQIQYNKKELGNQVELLHVIEPRHERDPAMDDNRNMPFASYHLQIAEPDNEDLGFLDESGFLKFPVLAPRWDVEAGNVYGFSPGMEALGMVRGLQQKHKRLAEAINYMTKPPLQVPTRAKNRDRQFLPGGITYYDQFTPHGGIRSAWEVNLDTKDLQGNIWDDRRLIDQVFMANLLLSLANTPPDQSPTRTATEVAKIHEEQILQIGPVLQNTQREMHEPLISETFDHLINAGMLPPPPPELEGVPLSVEFIGPLAQAQKIIRLNQTDRLIGGFLAVGEARPDVWDKLDVDQYADHYADGLGTEPELIVSNEKVRVLRDARAKAEAAQAQAEVLKTGSEAARNLAGAQVGTGSALDAVVGGGLGG